MSRRIPAALAAAMVISIASPAVAEKMTLTYPETSRVDLVETQFGEAVADPFRWLENDVRTDKAVADWVAKQNALTQGYLAQLPQRAWFAQRIKALMDYERFGLPHKAGANYFYMRNSGLQNQSQLFVRKGLNGAPRLLIDPNGWAKDGATALDAWVPSKNGKLLAYSIQDGGSDWRTIKLLDVTTGKDLGDGVKWAKFTNIAWIGSEGFLYSRFPEPQAGAEFQSLNKNQAIYFHRIGTPQSQDELVYATPKEPELGHSAEVTHDGKWVVITTSKGTDSRYAIHIMPMGKSRKWQAQTLIAGLDNAWNLIDGIGDALYFVTNKDAPRMKVVRFNLKKQALYRIPCEGSTKADDVCLEPRADYVDIIAERPETLDRAQIVGDRLVLSYLKDAKSIAEVRSLDGKPVQQIALNAIGTASGFTGVPGEPETFYSFSSFNQPSGIYRFDTRTGKSEPFALPKLTFNPDDYAIEQRFYTSKDGTRVPLFVVRRKDLAQANKAVPTLLYGYGGFDISLTPGFSAMRMAWLEAGGAFALANLRGGGEYGKAWHDAGRLNNKQNVFDDFIAAGEYLIAQGITPKNGLTIQGGSNGGLLIGAVVNQRPDLFAAANAAVGVMDMLRFDRFTAGRYWVDDYGYPSKEADWRVLRSYSPYHNIKVGVEYPAMLVTTADTDDRVVPGHSFKYTAALQAANAGDKPHLIRIETRAGHGSGKPTDKAVAEGADVLAFLAQWSGLQVPRSDK
ncbi:MAG: prolyl oligopeptidase family serine peptidase [Novosphingobium sp.]